MKFSTPIRLTALALLAVAAAGAQAEQAYAVSTTDGLGAVSLLSFDTSAPAGFATVGALSGVLAGHAVRAIDFRPADGKLYAVSSNLSTVGQLYTVNLATGALTTVGGTFALATTSSRISIDFNPVVDRLRVVSGAGNNLRVNPNDGTLVANDTNLTYGTATPLVGDVAYTNNVAGATSTTLYAYDYATDNIATIGGIGGTPSPNGGVLTTVGPTAPVSAFTAGTGFDISGATGTGYMSLDDSSSSTAQTEFYTVNLATGVPTLVAGEIGTTFLDFSVRTVTAPVPEPATMAALGLGVAALLRRRNKKA